MGFLQRSSQDRGDRWIEGDRHHHVSILKLWPRQKTEKQRLSLRIRHKLETKRLHPHTSIDTTEICYRDQLAIELAGIILFIKVIHRFIVYVVL
jgi:hypothetical protein